MGVLSVHNRLLVLVELSLEVLLSSLSDHDNTDDDQDDGEDGASNDECDDVCWQGERCSCTDAIGKG